MAVKKKAKKQTFVKVRIPQDPLNENLKTTRVIINGHYYDIKNGEEVSVPISVKEVLAKAGKI